MNPQTTSSRDRSTDLAFVLEYIWRHRHLENTWSISLVVALLVLLKDKLPLAVLPWGISAYLIGPDKGYRKMRGVTRRFLGTNLNRD